VSIDQRLINSHKRLMCTSSDPRRTSTVLRTCTHASVDSDLSVVWWRLYHNSPTGLAYVQTKHWNSIHRTYALPSDRDHFLSQLHRRGISCRLTFDSSPPSPSSRDISRPIYYCILLLLKFVFNFLTVMSTVQLCKRTLNPECLLIND